MKSAIPCLLWASSVTGLAAAGRLQLSFTRSAVQSSRESYVRRSDLEAPVYNDLPRQRYLINITVGTPPQAFAVTLDTGSADLWVPSPNSTGCAPHCPPTFHRSRSSTYKDTGLPFNVTYGLTPGLAIAGPYFNDTVHLEDAVLPNVTLGLGNVPPELYNHGQFGFMGLGSPLQESLVTNPSSPDFQNPNARFPLIYDQLFQHGYIKKRLFSIWLNDETASQGSILFGGIDPSKFRGPLHYVPLLASGPSEFTGWAVNLTSVHLNTSKGNASLLHTNPQLQTILDSGSPNMYLPPAVANAVAQEMNATMYQGFPYVSCKLRESPDSVQFGFGRNEHAGPNINVPYGEIIYPFGDPANIGPVVVNGTKMCYLGLIGTDGQINLLGDTFIRSTYVVYDVDNLRVGLAPVRYD